MNGKEYPALLMNLPTIVETHKTFDNKIFLKSGDIGQVLQVFETAAERDVMRGQICKTINGDYMPSGLTPPTADIVKRRFELTRKNDSYLPYRIRSVIDEIGHFGNGTGRLVNPVTGEPVQDVQTTTAVEVMSETVVEEVVDFEEWMVDPVTQSCRTGVSLTLHGSQLGNLKDLQLASNNGTSSSSTAAATVGSNYQLMLLLQHPEILVTEEEREEDQIDALAAEQARELKRNNSSAATAMQIDNIDDSVFATTSTSTAALTSATVTNNNNSGTSSATSVAPLKLSLSVRRPTTNTATTDDTTLLQDEDNDLNNADNAESNAQEGSDHESEQGDNQADAFEVEDSGDEGEQDQEEYPPYDQPHQNDSYQAGGLSPYGSHLSAPHAQYSAQSSALPSSHSANMPVQDEEEENESSDDDIETLLQARRQSEIAASNQPVGSGGAENIEEAKNKETEREMNDDDQDRDSVNSEDSDAWMNEA
uniref:TAFII55 protein conserved region domain-containing protein n=1 Tax=Spumella elongata TaxID=89044 RepID=A0A7S3M8N5_9STRA